MTILVAFAKLRKATIRFIMTVCMPTWKNSAWQIFLKLDIRVFFENVSGKIQVLFKSDKNNGYSAYIPKYIYDISLNSS